jgi:chromosomal replication initiation ATPase DnaA
MKPSDVITAVCDELNISKRLLVSKRRIQDLVEARWIVAYHLRRLFLLTYEEIGLLMNRSHAAFFFGLQRVRDLREVDKQFAEKFNRVERRLAV